MSKTRRSPRIQSGGASGDGPSSNGFISGDAAPPSLAVAFRLRLERAAAPAAESVLSTLPLPLLVKVGDPALKRSGAKEEENSDGENGTLAGRKNDDDDVLAEAPAPVAAMDCEPNAKRVIGGGDGVCAAARSLI